MFKQRKKIRELEKQLETLIQANEAMQSYSHLVGIEREGRFNKFIFRRNGELIEIETMSLMVDNLPEWKNKLLR